MNSGEPRNIYSFIKETNKARKRERLILLICTTVHVCVIMLITLIPYTISPYKTVARPGIKVDIVKQLPNEIYTPPPVQRSEFKREYRKKLEPVEPVESKQEKTIANVKKQPEKIPDPIGFDRTDTKKLVEKPGTEVPPISINPLFIRKVEVNGQKPVKPIDPNSGKSGADNRLGYKISNGVNAIPVTHLLPKYDSVLGGKSPGGVDVAPIPVDGLTDNAKASTNTGGSGIPNHNDIWADNLVAPELLNKDKVNLEDPKIAGVKKVFVTLKFLVDTGGNPRDPKLSLIELEPSSFCDDRLKNAYVEAAIGAVNQFKFNPARKGNESIPMFMKVTVIFGAKKGKPWIYTSSAV